MSDYDESDIEDVKVIEYTSDGLNETDYKHSDIKDKKEKVIRCEGCHNYFLVDGYIHNTKYKLGVDDLIICIHCYFSFNVTKYIEGKNITENEKKCLKHYVDYYTHEHNSSKCDRQKSYNICLLCMSKTGEVPTCIRSDKIIYEKPTDDSTYIIAYVKESFPHSFVLTL